MLNSVSLAFASCDSSVRVRQGNLADVSPSELVTLATGGLVEMFDTEQETFCFRLNRSQGRLVREGVSSRYTIMSLIGLQRLEAAGFESPIRIRGVLDRLLRDGNCITNIGDLGLTLWLCALASPERLEEIYKNLNVRHALSYSREARDRRTMELAWFLSGLAHAGAVSGQSLPGLADLANKTYRLLKQNQGAGGAFGHLFRSGTVAGFLRGHIGSFADQVYPIYALAKYAGVFQDRTALVSATRCGDVICRAQGVSGEWWWHYHSKTGSVLEHYPVYAVHQHGMGPMALFALAEATQVDFSEPIYKGLRWIAGENELAVDLRVPSPGIIWRGLYHRRTGRKYIGNALTYLGFPGTKAAGDLAIRFECRPYELGWLLYAFAGRSQ